MHRRVWVDYHPGQFGSYLSNFLERWKGTIEDGDVFLTNGIRLVLRIHLLLTDETYRPVLHRRRHFSSERFARDPSRVLQGQEGRLDGKPGPLYRVRDKITIPWIP